MSLTLTEPVQSNHRSGHTHSAGTPVEVLMLCPPWGVVVEVRVPDLSLLGGAWYDAVEVRSEGLDGSNLCGSRFDDPQIRVNVETANLFVGQVRKAWPAACVNARYDASGLIWGEEGTPIDLVGFAPYILRRTPELLLFAESEEALRAFGAFRGEHIFPVDVLLVTFDPERGEVELLTSDPRAKPVQHLTTLFLHRWLSDAEMADV